MAGLRPRAVVGSAAAGSDLLAAEAALRCGATVHLVLAGDAASFRSSSVVDKGERWGDAFDTLRSAASVESTEEPVAADDTGYAAVNDTILRTARGLLREHEELVVVAVTAGRDARRAARDHTEDLADAADLNGHLILRLDPTLRRETTPVAFVAMPFGRKPDPTGAGPAWESDATWHRVLTPALLACGYRPYRVDFDATTDIIDRKMIRAIASADLLVADLALTNPNVMWELGVRHTFARAGTLLVGPGSRPPFDVARIPVVPYDRDPGRVSSEQAVTSIRAVVRAVLAPGSLDSPVYAAIPDLLPPEMPAGTSEDNRFRETLMLISRERDLRDAEALRRLAATSAPGPEGDEIRVQIGYALLALDEMAAAADLLGPAARADKALARTELQERYALALIHSSAGRPEVLGQATTLLQALDARSPGSAEICGLLGSAAKRAFEANPEADGAEILIRGAADSYERGFQTDPTDTYTGVNALAILGALGRRDHDEDLLGRASRLEPVLRFALDRPGAARDPWHALTDAEAHLHAALASDERDGPAVVDAYRHALRAASPQQVASAARQVALIAALGGAHPTLDLVATAITGSLSGRGRPTTGDEPLSGR